MSYRVIYSPTFVNCVSEQVDYLREQQVSDQTIEQWFDRLFRAVDDLNEWPRRYPVDETTTEQAGFEVRKLVFGRYVITYSVNEPAKTVEVLAMIHSARRR